jgi:hypothetical protein
MEGTRDETENQRAMYQAFHSDPTEQIKAFRDYWRKEGDTAREASSLLVDVVSGKTPISEQIIASCRQGVMRLHQIRYVLGQWSLNVGTPRESVNAVMTIVARADADALEARKNLKTILTWAAAAYPELEVYEPE